MKVLLDTNILLFAGNGTLSRQAQTYFEDSGYQKHYSVASIWEIVIKTMIGKLSLAMPVEEFEAAMVMHGIRKLDIQTAHIYGIQNLEDMHSDPFDRIMVAQAQTEEMQLVTSDKALEGYDDCISYCPH